MEQVLPLCDLNIDPREFQTRDISEFTAEEYLAWVRYEAENCEQVVRANVDLNLYAGQQTPYMPKVPEIPICSDALLPEEYWIDQVLDSFSELRLLLARLSEDIRSRERKITVPPLKQESLWFKLCLGENSHLSRTIEENQQIDSVEIVEDEESEPVEGECVDIDLETQKEDLIREFAPSSNLSSINHEVSIQYSVGVVPTTSLMLQFDQVLTQKLIGYHVKWLTIRISRIQELYEFRDEEFSLPIDELVLQWECMISLHCKWIYSLLVRLETPLYQDAAADIREIYRTTCMARWNFEQFVVSLLRSPKGKELISKISPREQSKSIQSKGVVRFSGIFDEDAQREFDDSDSINLDDLNLFSSELYHKAEDYLASLNTIISICGRYFGQEEEYVGRSSNWNMEGSNDSSYEDGEEEEEEDMEEFEDEDVL